MGRGIVTTRTCDMCGIEIPDEKDLYSGTIIGNGCVPLGSMCFRCASINAGVLETVLPMVGQFKIKPFSEYDFGTASKVFITGPMTGYENWNAAAFNECAAEIDSVLSGRPGQSGYEIINPADDIPAPDEVPRSHGHYMLDTLTMICAHTLGADGNNRPDLDAVVLLPGWEKSEGAVMEALVAYECGIDLVAWK